VRQGMFKGADPRTQSADPKKSFVARDLSRQAPPHTHRATEDPRQGVVGRFLRAYGFYGMEKPEMSRQKFGGF
jgi:hypothetical protein